MKINLFQISEHNPHMKKKELSNLKLTIDLLKKYMNNSNFLSKKQTINLVSTSELLISEKPFTLIPPFQVVLITEQDYCILFDNK